MWWKRKEPKNSVDRQALVEAFANEVYFIDQKWPEQNKEMLGLFLAIDWRTFLVRFGSSDEFALMGRDSQFDYFSKLLSYSAEHKAKADLLRVNQPNQSLDHLLQHYSAKFLSNYLICLIEDDNDWRKEITALLNPFIHSAWTVSTSVFATGNPSLDGHLAIAME